jgi:hypothetical protein
MASIIRIDYFSSSIVIDLSLIAYITLKAEMHEVPVKVPNSAWSGVTSKEFITLSIAMLDNVGSVETFVQHKEDETGEFIKKEYLNLFTQWRNFQNENRNTELKIMGVEV